MKYNKALDFAALALNASSKGKHTLAAKLFAKAVTSPDVGDALRIIEASNGKAFDEQVQARKAAIEAAAAKKVEAAKKAPVKAEAVKRIEASDAVGQDDLVAEDDCGDEELGADLVEDDVVLDDDADAMSEELPQEELAGDLDELEDEGEGEPAADADEGEVDDTAAFAAVLASMQTKVAAAKVPAKKVTKK